MKLKLLKNIKDPTIAKQKYEQARLITNKLDYNEWVKYIDENQDYYTPLRKVSRL